MVIETMEIEFKARFESFRQELARNDALTKKQQRAITQEWVDNYKLQVTTAREAERAKVIAARKAAEEQTRAIQKAADEQERAVKQAAEAEIRALRAAEAEAQRLAEKLADVGDQAGKVARTGSLIGGRFGGAISTAADITEFWDDGLSSVGKKILFMAGGVAVATAAIGAMVSVGIKAVDVVQNFGDYVEAAGGATARTEAMRGAIEDAQDAMAGAERAVAGLSLRLGGEFADEIETSGRAVAGFVHLITDMQDALTDLRARQSESTAAQANANLTALQLATTFPTLTAAYYAGSAALDALATYGDKRNDEVEREVELQKQAHAAAIQQADDAIYLAGLLGLPSTTPTAEDPEKLKAAEEAQRAAEKARQDRDRRRAEAQRTAEKAASEAHRAAEQRAAAEARWVEESIQRAGKQAEEAWRAYEAQRAVTASLSAAFSELGRQMEQTYGEQLANQETALSGSLARQQQMRQAAASAIASQAAAFTDSLIGLANTIGDNEVNQYREGSKEHKKALKKQFAAQKAAAIAQATISLALGIANVWSQWAAMPVVAAVLTGLVAGVGAAQIGIIAAQKPTFHTGGMVQSSGGGGGVAPDEVSGMRLQTGEGVLTRRGVDAIGGEQALRKVNEGRPPMAASTPMMAVAALDGRVLDAVWSGRGPSGRGGLAARMDSRLRGGSAGRTTRWGR